MAAFVFSFMILGSRHGSTFLPRRDYSFFIGAVWTLHGVDQSCGALAPFGNWPTSPLVGRDRPDPCPPSRNGID